MYLKANSNSKDSWIELKKLIKISIEGSRKIILKKKKEFSRV